MPGHDKLNISLHQSTSLCCTRQRLSATKRGLCVVCVYVGGHMCVVLSHTLNVCLHASIHHVIYDFLITSAAVSWYKTFKETNWILKIKRTIKYCYKSPWPCMVYIPTVHHAIYDFLITFAALSWYKTFTRLRVHKLIRLILICNSKIKVKNRPPDPLFPTQFYII